MIRKIHCIILLLCVGTVCASAQQPGATLPRRTLASINQKAKGALVKYTQFLNKITKPQEVQSGEQLDIIIEGYFSNDHPNYLFLGDEWQLDREEDGDKPADADETPARPYFQRFRNNYKQSEDNSINCKFTESSKVYIGSERYFLRIYFKQTMKGTDRSGKPYPKETRKYMDLQVVPKNNDHIVLISDIGFVEKATEITAPEVKVGDAFNIGINSKQYSPAYYTRQLEDGRGNLRDQRYYEAYVALKEASGSPATEAEASRLINEIYERLRSLKQLPNEYLYGHLIDNAEALRDKYRYAESRKFFEYAKEVKPASTAPLIAMEEITRKEKQLQLLEEVLLNGAYQQAIEGYQAALLKQDDNPNLYVGLARANMALGRYANADTNFRLAARYAVSFADIYRYQAQFYSLQSDYERAFEALRFYQGYTDDPGEASLLSDIAYNKGLALWANRQPGALDSFRAASAYFEGNTDAQIAQAEVLSEQGDIKGARSLITRVMKGDNLPAEGYHALAKIYAREAQMNPKQDLEDKAIEAYKTATTQKPDNIRWQYELAELLVTQTKPDLAEAIVHLNICIATPVNIINRKEAGQLKAYKRMAQLLRAKCLYYQNKDAEADQEFKQYFADERYPAVEARAGYALLLIRMGSTEKAIAELNKADREIANILLVRSILAYMQGGAYENFMEQALVTGLKSYEILNAPRIADMAKSSKKVQELLKARRGIRF